MLEKFAAAGIEATWATVGMLFAENEEEWKAYQPEYLPSYRNKEYSAYEWVKKNGIRPEVHFAPELIRLILQTPGQELASHSFAHYYTLMRGQSPEQFREDLKATQKIAGDKFDQKLSSLVFPRNHMNELYLKICLEEGYTDVRGNPKNWFWQETQHEDLSKKLFRSADCFLPMGERTSFSRDEIELIPEEPLIIPASRILLPFYKTNFILNTLRIKRIKGEMSYAAKNQEVYHLWWHPHNFGNDPVGAMLELDEIITHYLMLKSKYGMESLSMKGVGEMVRGSIF